MSADSSKYETSTTAPQYQGSQDLNLTQLRATCAAHTAKRSSMQRKLGSTPARVEGMLVEAAHLRRSPNVKHNNPRPSAPKLETRGYIQPTDISRSPGVAPSQPNQRGIFMLAPKRPLRGNTMPEFALLSAIAEEQEKCKESTTKADIMDRLRRLKIPTQMREVGTKSQPGSMRSPTKRRRSISTMAGVSLPSSLIIPVEKQGRRRSSVSSVVDDSILRSPTTPKEEKGQKQKRNSIFIRNEWLKERKQLWAPVPKWISY